MGIRRHWSVAPLMTQMPETALLAQVAVRDELTDGSEFQAYPVWHVTLIVFPTNDGAIRVYE